MAPRQDGTQPDCAQTGWSRHIPNAISPSDLARGRGVSRAAFWDTLALTLRGFMEGVVDVRAVCKPAMRRLCRMVVAIDEMRLSTGPVLGRCTDARHCEDFLQ